VTTTRAPQSARHTCRAAGIASTSYNVRGQCLAITVTILALLAAFVLLMVL